jgi:hypothetical protein
MVICSVRVQRGTDRAACCSSHSFSALHPVAQRTARSVPRCSATMARSLQWCCSTRSSTCCRAVFSVLHPVRQDLCHRCSRCTGRTIVARPLLYLGLSQQRRDEMVPRTRRLQGPTGCERRNRRHLPGARASPLGKTVQTCPQGHLAELCQSVLSSAQTLRKVVGARQARCPQPFTRRVTIAGNMRAPRGPRPIARSGLSRTASVTPVPYGSSSTGQRPMRSAKGRDYQ